MKLSLRALAPAALLALALTGAGCGTTTTTTTGPDGGVFITRDQGEIWKQLKVLNLGAKQASIAGMGIVALANDPQDAKVIYAGTVENGVVYSLDSGDSWQSAGGLNAGRVNAIAVHPKEKCTIFAARNNQIMKTDNCSRDWTQAYFDPRTDKQFLSLVIDWYNPSVLYAGTSDGDIVKSENGGVAWKVVNRVDGAKILELVMDPTDSRVLYGLVDRQGLVKTVDGGQTWTPIKKELDAFDGARRGNHIVLDPTTKGRVYLISRYGITKSDDAGATWTALSLPTPPGTVDMRAFAVHPKDKNRLVYATDKAVIWSVDGGQTWTPKKLPSTRGASTFLYTVTPEQTTLFMGTLPATK